MAEHCGYIVEIKDLRKHSNADRLQIATIFGNDVVVDMKTKVGDIGVFFPVDIQLSERYCQVNDLVRRKDENGNPAGGFLEPGKRNIKALRLRGEKSEGLFMPLVSLADFCTISDLKVGDRINTLNGEEICRKYIPKRNPTRTYAGYRPHKAKANIAPLFFEHVETEQLAYNLEKFKPGDIVQLTLKMHGTSGRTGHLPLVTEDKQYWWQKLFKMHPHTHLEYGYITGTRRVVLDGRRKGGFYDSDDFREAMARKFEGKLLKNETIYYEICGFQGKNDAPIMAECANSKVKDKEFSRIYGDKTTFSYGCDPNGDFEPRPKVTIIPISPDGNTAGTQERHSDEMIPPCCDVYVYRMTMVNEDGDVVEYSPAQIRYRCEQIGVKTVLEFETFIIPEDETNPGEYVVRKVEQYYDGPDPIGKTHVREGVVARILNRNSFAVYKMKNFSFRVLEGIIKDEADAPDMEEAQELPEIEESTMDTSDT